MQSALGRLPEIRNGLYIDPETGDELSMKTWWIDGADTNVPTSLGVDVTTLLNKIGAIGNAQEFEPSTYYTAEDEEVIGGTKEVGELKTPAVAAVPHTVKSYVDNAVANVHVDIDASNIYTKSEVDQKFEDLIGQAPETLDTLKEIADKLSDEDTSLGQLNAILAVKADASTTYTKSEVDTLYNNINSSLNNYVLNSSLIDVEEVIAESITQLNDTLDELSGNIYTKDEIDNLIVTSNDLSIYELKSDLINDLSIYELKSDLANDLSIYELKSDLSNDLSIYVLKTDLEDTEKVIATTLIQINDSITTIDASIIDIKQNGAGNSGINSSVLDNYVLKTYIGTLPNKTENIYYTQEEITNASAGDDAYGKTTTDIKTPATQYTDLMEAIEEDEEVTAAAIVDMNSKVTDISTRLDNIVTGPAIWVGTQSQYNLLESISQSTIYIIRAEEL